MRVPPRLAILGGGVVACEMAAAWQSLGSAVTILELGPRLLERMEPFVGDRIAAALREQGVRVHTDAKPTRVERTGMGRRLKFGSIRAMNASNPMNSWSRPAARREPKTLASKRSACRPAIGSK